MNIPPEWIPTVEAMAFLAIAAFVVIVINEINIRRRGKKPDESNTKA